MHRQQRMSATAMMNPPVILSDNRRNVILHGRPLTPIGTARSTSPFFLPRPPKGLFTEEKHGDNLSVRSSAIIAPSTTLMDYQKSAHENLVTINNNLSLMLKESFAGIDNICKKVRLCLLDANPCIKPDHEVGSTPEQPKPTIQTPRTETPQVLTICEEEVVSSQDDISNIADDQVDEIIEENIEESKEKIKNVEGKVKKDDDKESADKPKRIPSGITPFFTILNATTQSVESVDITSKMKIGRKCTVENFQKSMKEVEKLTDYEQFLTSMVDGINKEIDKCYFEYPRVEVEEKKITSGGDESTEKNKERKFRKQEKARHAMNMELKKYHEVKKMQRELMEEQFSENDISPKSSRSKKRALNLCTAQMDLYPDVYRKKAITDLHRRLEAQVEANDSLIFFQKLMSNYKKNIDAGRPSTEGHDRTGDTVKSPVAYLLNSRQGESRKQRSLNDLTKKYQDSLWFRQKRNELKRKRKECSSQKKKKNRQGEKKEEKVLPKSYTLQSSLDVDKSELKKTPQASECKCNIQITNEQPISESQKCRLHWMRMKYSQMSSKKLQHIDILDEVTTKDLLPIKAEYPRRDEIGTPGPIPGLKGSYLYKLISERSKETEIAWRHLLEPRVRCSQESCGQCNSTASISNKDHQPVSVINDDNFKKKKDPPPSPVPPSTPPLELPPRPRPSTCPEASSTDKRDVMRTLSKYIFLDEAMPKQTDQVFTVMPVHVFYDNARSHSTHRRQGDIAHKLPLVPMKETKDFARKGEWTDGPKKIKPTRVYDPILKKIEKEIRTNSAKLENKSKKTRLCETSSWSPKNFASYQASPQRNTKDPRAICVKIEAIDKTLRKLKCKPVPPPNVVKTPIAEIYKRSPKNSAVFRSPKNSVERITPPSLPPWIAVTLDYKLQQKDSELKQKIQRSISNESQLKAKSNEQQKKIWENKYGKSVGQKLVNFVEKQPAVYQADVPKHALLPKNNTKNPTRQQIVLEQLRNLKDKNDHIQDNIQRAIAIIEKKMVEILSKPVNTHSIEAFDQMEKEITNVLSLLKTPNSQKVDSLQEKSAKVEEIENVSEELFKRLDKILESPAASNSTKSSKNSLKKVEKPTKQSKLKLCSPPRTSVDMNQVCFSSTSASGEEKFTITAISPRRALKGPFMTPFIVSSTNEGAAISEDVATITNELRKLEHELNLDTVTVDEVKNQDVEEQPEKEAKPTRETATKTTPLSKGRNIVPVQKQVVNLALVKQKDTKKTPPPSGDQSPAAPKKTPEKSSDEDKNSMGVTYSQGDCAARLEDVSMSVYLDSDTFGLERGTLTSDEKYREFSSFLASSSPTEDIRTSQEEATTKTTTTSSIPTTPNKDPIKQRASQLSLTGPYYTPVTSPLNKTRLGGDEEIRAITPIAEEERLPASVTEEEKRLGSTQTIDSDERACQTEPEACQSGGSSASCKDSKGRGYGSLSKEENSNGKKEDFYDNVNKIITRVENVYNQLEEFEEEMLGDPNQPPVFTTSPETVTKVAVFKEVRPPTPEIAVDAFLTPFMHAVKDLRRSCSEKTTDSHQSSPRMMRSPSFFNVLSFLDSLADMKHEKPIEVYSTRVCQSCYTVHIPQTFRFATLLHQTLYCQVSVPDVPKKKSSCLKNPSSHSNFASAPSKSRQKVSFWLVKEEKSTQVTPCPFHSMARVLSQQKVSRVSSNETLSSNKRDEQVSAYLDARENKSTDKMSLDEEGSYQSTFELSEEVSTQQMPIQLAKNHRETLENDRENKKNVVELFRNSNAEENRAVRVFTEENREDANGGPVGEPVRVFYDDLTTICGFYNEESILQVQRSLSKNVAVKKRDSPPIIADETDKFCAEIVSESTELFSPPKHIDRFIDSKFLTEVIEKRQKMRMMRRKGSNRSIEDDKLGGVGEGKAQKVVDDAGGEEKKNLIKGLYVFVYLLMFTALNLEYKCVQ